MPDLPNPIDSLASGFGAGFTAAAGSAFDAAMTSLWEFAVSLTGGVFSVIDQLTTPDLDPRTGPLAAVMPATIWVGGALLVTLSLFQVGKAAMSGGTGLLHLFKGLAQYLVVSATALGILAALVTAANAAALGILTAGLGTSSWAGISHANSAWQNSVNGASGVGLGLIGLLGVIPASFSLLIITIVREAAILVIAATIPVLAAGLVAEATARWFWVALRWLLALVMLTPAVALVLSIGLHLAAGVSDGSPTGSGTGPGQSVVSTAVAAGVLLVAVFCPLALFKLFAFVDPSTGSGQRLRTSLTDGATTAALAAGGGPAAAAGVRTAQEADTEQQVDSRWHQAVTSLSIPHQAMAAAAQQVMSGAAPVLAAAGVGHGLDHDPTPVTRTSAGRSHHASHGAPDEDPSSASSSVGTVDTSATDSKPSAAPPDAQTDAPAVSVPFPGNDLTVTPEPPDTAGAQATSRPGSTPTGTGTP